MKKLLLIISAVFLLCTGCSGREESISQVVASFYPMELLTEAIAGDIVSVSSMAPQVQGCLHNYQLLPSDMMRISDAEMFVINGLGMESFRDMIIEQAPDTFLVDAGAVVTDPKVIENGHAWLHLPSAIQQTVAIESGLSEHWPQNAETYRANGDALRANLTALQTRLEALSGSEAQAVCFHEGLALLAEESGIEVIAVLSLDEKTPTSSQLRKILKSISASPRCFILTDKGAPVYAIQEKVLAETDAIECSLYTMTRREGEKDFLYMMEYNVRALEQALEEVLS
ncbi:MAG: metal ABC transporter substrate-binding protein [Christensenellales bacterium]|jgi:zinc transport system substrate-binding protein